MAQPKKGMEAFLHLVKQPLEKFLERRGEDVVLAMPAVRLAIFRLRQLIGKQDFEQAMEKGVGVARAMGFSLRWSRRGPLNPAVSNFIWELVEEVGGALAKWSKEVDDDELAELIAEELRQPAMRGQWMGELADVVEEILERLPSMDDILPPPAPPGQILAAMLRGAATIRNFGR